jgi:ligand-binding SRPBCC domain-containing protein/ketosteroid isomerase-like protein
MSQSRERAIAGVTRGRMGLQDDVTWRAWHFGLRWTMTNRITAFDRPRRFVDEQVRGPFASFRHEHRFDAEPGGTLMVDRVEFSAPLGWAGWLFERVVLGRYLAALLRRRNAFIRGRASDAVAHHGGGETMQTSTTSTDRERLAALNRDYVESVQAGDVARFDAILADDFLCSNPDGTLVDKRQLLEQTARPVTITGLTADDVQIRILGDVAIIHARTSYTTPSGDLRHGRYTDVWVRRGDTWLAVSAHVTR